MMENHRPDRPNAHAIQTTSSQVIVERQESEARIGGSPNGFVRERQPLAASSPMLFTCRPDGRWDYVSPALCAYTGRSAEALVEFGWAAALPADTRTADLRRWQLATGHGAPFAVEQRLRGADGTYRRFRLHGEDRRTIGGTLIGWVGLIAPIEREHQNTAEPAPHEQTQAVHDTRDTMLAIAGHELRSPLTVLLGQAQLLQRRLAARADANPADQRAAEVVVAQAQRLARLVNALLDVTHIEHDQMRICATTIDLGALVERVVQALQPTLPAHTLRLRADPAPLWVAGDALRLEQVLHNLLQNAVKYSPRGGEIVLRTMLDGAQVQVEVCDQGIGIAASAQPALFQRFSRAGSEGAQVVPGLGIGLYICKAIIDLHGGSISVESHEGIGSTFTLRLTRLQPLSAG